MSNFDLRKFLAENKLTTNSRLNEENGKNIRSVFSIYGGQNGFSVSDMPDFTQSLNKQGVADYIMDVYYEGDAEDFADWIDHVTYYDYDKQDYIYGNFSDEAFVIPLDEESGLLVIDKGIALTSSESKILQYYKDLAL